MNSLPAIKRIYYTAFLYAEYIFRNIEENYSELVRSVKFFKELIQKILHILMYCFPDTVLPLQN